jgi:hypothetical protein
MGTKISTYRRNSRAALLAIAMTMRASGTKNIEHVKPVKGAGYYFGRMRRIGRKQ